MDNIVQYIIVRKDLNMSHGKMAAQVAHASIASLLATQDTYETQQWLSNSFTKVVLKAKNKTHLLNLTKKLSEYNIPYFPITDNCRTELERESKIGTLTCIAIKPITKEYIYPLIKRYQLYS